MMSEIARVFPGGERKKREKITISLLLSILMYKNVGAIIIRSCVKGKSQKASCGGWKLTKTVTQEELEE